MQVRTSGDLRRIDVQPGIEGLAALLAEWAELRFDPSGMVLNPLTGAAHRDLTLVEGRHRSPGARYEITTEWPVYGTPEDLKAGFEREERQLHHEGVSMRSPEYEDFVRRRAEASVRIGTTTSTTLATLTRDDTRQPAATLTGQDGLWTVDA